jgi:hypothetical protein
MAIAKTGTTGSEEALAIDFMSHENDVGDNKTLLMARALAKGAYRTGLTSGPLRTDPESPVVEPRPKLSFAGSSGKHAVYKLRGQQSSRNEHPISIAPPAVRRDLSFCGFAMRYGPLLDQINDEMVDDDHGQAWAHLRKRSKLVEMLRTAATEGHANAYRLALRVLLALLKVQVPNGIVSPFTRSPGTRRTEKNKSICAAWDSMGNPLIDAKLCELLAARFDPSKYQKAKKGSVVRKRLISKIGTALRNYKKRQIATT